MDEFPLERPPDPSARSPSPLILLFSRGWSWFRFLVPPPYRNRSASFTGEGKRFVLFTLAVGVAAINTGNNLFYLLVAMMLSLITMSALLSELCLRKLELSCHAPEFVYANTPSTLTLVLTNPRRRFPGFSLRLAEIVRGRPVDRDVHIKYLPAGETVLVSYPIHVVRRGRYDVDGVQIATPFPFGLFIKTIFLPQPFSLLVLPRPQPLPAGMLAGTLTDGPFRAIARKGPGADLYNLRLYQPGDDSRLIHWMSTARTAQLMVRETEADMNLQVTICLSTASPETAHAAFEQAVILTASLIAHFHARAFQVCVQVGAMVVTSRQTGDDLPRLLTPLGLCSARSPEDVERDQPDASKQNRPRGKEMIIAVLPWSSAGVRARYAHATEIIEIDDYLSVGPLDGTGTGIPA